MVAEGEPLVVDTGEVHDRGLHVVHMDGVGGDVPGVVVSRPVDVARLHAAACQPPTEGMAEVIAALGAGWIALPKGCAAKLTAPGHQGVVEHAPLFEVEHEGRRRALGVATLHLQVAEKIAVLIPAGMHQLYKSHTSLEQPSGDEAVVGEAAFGVHVGSVAIEYVLWFIRKIDEFWHTGLHPIGHLILCDAGVDLRITGGLAMRGVECGDVVEQCPPRFASDAGWIGQVGHRIAGVAKLHALIPAGEKAATPVVIEEQLPAGLLFVGGGHHHKRRQVVRLASQAITQPRTHAGTARHLAASQKVRHARSMVDRFGVHAANQTQLVSNTTDSREEFAHLNARRAVFAKRLDRWHAGPFGVAARHRGEPRVSTDAGGDILAGSLANHRLRIKQIDVRRASALPEHHDPLGLRLMMGEFR